MISNKEINKNKIKKIFLASKAAKS